MKMEVVGAVASVGSIIELSAKVVSSCHKYVVAVKNAEKDIIRLSNETENLKEILQTVQKRSRQNDETLMSSPAMVRSLDDCFAQLSSLEDKLRPPKSTGLRSKLKLRKLEWPFESREVDKIIGDLHGYKQSISLSLQIDQAVLVEQLDTKFDLAKLPFVEGATYDSFSDQLNARCHEETRVDLRQTIRAWAEDLNGKCIFWLNGMAGTGKSTISRTLAQEFDDQGELGASFFFKRGEGDRGNVSRFFPTVVAQLARYLPSVAPHVDKALREDSAVASKTLKDQFEKLFLQPLTKVEQQTPKALLIVIDTLDECDNDGHVKLMLQLLGRLHTDTSVHVKIFITSRPELPIRLGFSQMSKEAHQDLVLHDIPVAIVEHDLVAYLTSELEQIRNQNQDDLPQDWPGKENVRILAAMAVPLFIFAATICRFIGDDRLDPDAQLKAVLEYKDAAQEDQLDRTYRPVLARLLDGLTATQKLLFTKEFQLVVGSIVILENPLSSKSLAKLLDMPSKSIDRKLSLMHSVLNVPSDPDLPIRLLHLSFRDYLVDTRRHGEAELFIDEEEAHQTLATHCLELLLHTSCLKQDICDLKHPGILRQEIDKHVIASALPPEVQYACQYWAFHLKQGHCGVSNRDKLRRFLETRLLYWLEALGLLGRASESISMIAAVKHLDTIDNRLTINLLHDVERFVLTYSSMIDIAPLQLYSSAIIFSPESSIIREINQKYAPKWLGRLPQRQKAWNATSHVLDGHSGAVNSVVFFPDGRKLASASSDKTVRIWDVSSEKLEQILEGHTNDVLSVAVSPDGKLLITSSWDSSIRIWDSATGEPVQTIISLGYGNATFSSDSLLAAWAVELHGSRDWSIQVWSLVQKKSVHILGCYNDLVESLAFAPAKPHIASGSNLRGNGIIKIWDHEAGICLKTMAGDRGDVNSLAYSPDGDQLAAATSFAFIDLWDSNTGMLLQTIEGECSGFHSVAYSPIDRTVASCSDDLEIYDVTTGTHLHTLTGHASVVESVCFSPDGAQIASSSSDHTVRIWSISSLTGSVVADAQLSKVDWVKYSPDATILASASVVEDTIRLWSTSTGALVATIPDVALEFGEFIFSLDSKQLASVSKQFDADGAELDNQYVQLHDVDSGLQLRALEENSLGVRAMVFSLDNNLLAASLKKEQECWVWRTTSASRLSKFTYSPDYGHAMAITFSPDYQRIAASFYFGQFEIWDIISSSRLHKLGGHRMNFAYCMTFSPDSKKLLSGSDIELKAVRLWDIDTGNLSATIKAAGDNPASTTSVAFSPLGDRFAASFRDGSTFVWKLAGSSASLQDTFDVGSLERLLFCSHEPYLETERGLIKIGNETPSSSASTKSPRRNAIFLKGNWITRDGENLLWLPPEYRPRTVDFKNDVLTIGHASGLISSFKFQFDD